MDHGKRSSSMIRFHDPLCQRALNVEKITNHFTLYWIWPQCRNWWPHDIKMTCKDHCCNLVWLWLVRLWWEMCPQCDPSEIFQIPTCEVSDSGSCKAGADHRDPKPPRCQTKSGNIEMLIQVTASNEPIKSRCRSTSRRWARETKGEGNSERLAAGRRGRQRSLRLICACAFRSLSNPIPLTHSAHSLCILHIPFCLAPFHALSTTHASEFIVHIRTHLCPVLVSFAVNRQVHLDIPNWKRVGFLASLSRGCRCATWLCIEVNFVPTLRPSWPVPPVWVLFDFVALWSRGMHFGVMYWAGRWGSGR